MGTFIAVVLVIVTIIVFLAAAVWPMLVWMICDQWRIRTRVAHTVACLLAIALMVTGAINSGAFADNNAAHCGPGTRYVSESHYNPATKTTVTEWLCVVA
jgi:hypothetical protein